MSKLTAESHFMAGLWSNVWKMGGLTCGALGEITAFEFCFGIVCI